MFRARILAHPRVGAIALPRATASGIVARMNAPPPRPTALSRYRDGNVSISIDGVKPGLFSDGFHAILRMSWPKFIGLLLLAFFATNALFAGLFLLGGDCIQGARHGSFADALWFSVQSLATIGYGGLLPSTNYANALVSIESFVGLLGVAMGTGLMFAKFTRPVSRVSFSQCIVVHPHNGVPTLMFRMANGRTDQIVEARLSVSVLVETVSSEGTQMRRFMPLVLERDASPMFALSWTAMHRLDESSPLHGLSPANVHERMVALMAVLTGTDDTLSQAVHARYLYTAEHVRFGERFVDIVHDEGTHLRLDHSRLHDTEPFGG